MILQRCGRQQDRRPASVARSVASAYNDFRLGAYCGIYLSFNENMTTTIYAAERRAHLSNDQLLSLYRCMLLIRRCEEQLARAHQRGLIHGACHTYVGQEAIAAGVCAHLRGADAVFSTHRGHGHALAKGEI